MDRPLKVGNVGSADAEAGGRTASWLPSTIVGPGIRDYGSATWNVCGVS